MTNGNDPINQIPYINKDGTIQHDVYIGLTKREYFAAMVMQGILSNSSRDNYLERLVNDSVEIADALIKALNDNQ